MTEAQKKVKALSLCGYCGNQDECFEKEDCMTRTSFIDDQRERDKKVIASHSAAKSDAVLDDFVDWCKDAISSLEEKQCDGYKQFADVVKIELLHHELKIIKELRQQKER